MIGKRLVLAAGLSALVALPAPAFAQIFLMRGGFGGPPPLMLLLRSANLTHAQKVKLHTIMRSSRAKVRPLFEQIHSIHEQIASKLLGPGKVKASDFSALEQQKAKVQQQIAKNMIDTSIEIRNLMTPAQLSKMAETHQKLESLHKQMKALIGPPHSLGPHDGPPPPPAE